MSMEILASRGQSKWLAHQQGGLFEVNKQDTLYSMCTFKCPLNGTLILLLLVGSSSMAVVYSRLDHAKQLRLALSGRSMDFALLLVSSKIQNLKSLQYEDLEN